MSFELGYNYLNTAFTGTNSPALSGSSDPKLEDFILPTDNGTAGRVDQFELRSYFGEVGM